MRWFLVSLILASSRLFASDFAAKIDLHNRESIELAANDNPIQATNLIMERLKDPLVRDDPVLFVRALYALCILASNYEYFPEFKSLLDRAIQVAGEQGLTHEKIMLTFFAQGATYADNMQAALIKDSREFEAKFRSILREAEQQKAFSAAARIRLSFAIFLRDLGRNQESIAELVKATRELAKDDKAFEILKAKLNTALAQSIAYQGDRQKGKDLFLEVDIFCQKTPLADMCLTNLYNLGRIHALESDQESLRKAESYFARALTLSLNSSNRLMQATIRNGKVLVFGKRKQFAEAEREALQAVALFRLEKDPIWEGDTYKNLAVFYNNWQKPDKALWAVEQARKLFPPDFARDLMELDQAAYQAHKKLKKWQLALESHEKYLAAFQAASKEAQDEVYAKTKVDMGLQLEEERNKNLQDVNKLQQEKIKDAERLKQLFIGICVLFVITCAVLMISLKQAKSIKKQKIMMHRILDNIEEGLMTINKKLEIDPLFSEHLRSIFLDEQELAGKNFLELLQHHEGVSSERSSIIFETLKASIGEGELQWEFNQSQLPNELPLRILGQSRIFSVHWQALYDQTHACEKFLVSLRDITVQKDWEKKAQLEERKVIDTEQRIQHLFRATYRKSRELFERMEAILQFLPTELSRLHRAGEMFRDLHTLKGVARALGFSDISLLVHDLEEFFRRDKNELIDSQQYELARNALFEAYASYQHIIQDLFSNKGRESFESKNLCDLVNPLISELEKRLEAVDMHINRLCIDDAAFPWSDRLIPVVEDVLVHGLNNAIDHGYLIPKSQGQAVGLIRLEIKALAQSDGLHLSIADEGVGLHLEALRKKADDIDFRPEPGGSFLDVVFCDEVSTADAITVTSGRGMGLSAVKQRVTSVGGQVRLQARDQGALLEIFIPSQSQEHAA